MSDQQQKPKSSLPAFIIVIVIIAAVTIVAVAKKFGQTAAQPAPQSLQTQEHEHKHEPDEHTAPATEPAETKALTLNDIVKAAKTWAPAFVPWYGQMVEDFTVSDIEGKTHKLSDYRGKDVIVVFWATWCPACNMEIPHLIELRNTIGRDKLAILAVSSENPANLKRFAEAKKLNYTVVSGGRNMPAPFAYIRGIPANFFINPEGKMKFAAEGLLSLEETKAILQAK